MLLLLEENRTSQLELLDEYLEVEVYEELEDELEDEPQQIFAPGGV